MNTEWEGVCVHACWSLMTTTTGMSFLDKLHKVFKVLLVLIISLFIICVPPYCNHSCALMLSASI